MPVLNHTGAGGIIMASESGRAAGLLDRIEAAGMDVAKHIEHWRSGGEDDLAAARSLLASGHVRQALFLAHLALEKMLKAHVTRATGDIPPRTHNLVRLAELAALKVDLGREDFLRRFNAYQLEARYPDANGVSLGLADARERFASVEETIQWLRTRL